MNSYIPDMNSYLSIITNYFKYNIWFLNIYTRYKKEGGEEKQHLQHTRLVQGIVMVLSIKQFLNRLNTHISKDYQLFISYFILLFPLK